MEGPHPIRVIAGGDCAEFATKVCKFLGVSLCPSKSSRFADGEVGFRIDVSIRGCDVFLIQSTCPPVNDHLMELLLMLDAVKRASAASITVVVPYLGYCRQDRKTQPRVPISAALVAELIEAAGAHRVVTIDLHCGQIQGFYRIPVDNLMGASVLAGGVADRFDLSTRFTIVSPDAGGVERAVSFRLVLDKYGFHTSMAIMNKRREQANVVASMELVGSVDGSDCIIVDDMIDTAGTLARGALTLKEKGAKRVFACASHALLNGEAVSIIEKSVLEAVFVMDTVPEAAAKAARAGSTKIITLTSTILVGEAIRAIYRAESVSSLMNWRDRRMSSSSSAGGPSA